MRGVLLKCLGITGTPGTGKKTLAREFEPILHYKIVNINSLCISKGAVLGKDKYGLIANINKLRVIVKKEIDKNGSIIVGHLLSYVLSPKNIDLSIVLRCDPYILEQRLNARGYPEKKVLMNVGAEILGSCYFHTVKKMGKSKVHVIDNSTRKPEETLVEALKAVNEGVRYDGSDIDWLGLVRERGDLGRFFPDSYY